MHNPVLIVNRQTAWYSTIDVRNNPYFTAISILKKLSTNKIRGLKYSPISIQQKISDQVNTETQKLIDDAVVLLVSRSLINFTFNNQETKIWITELGEKALMDYEEELKNVD